MAEFYRETSTTLDIHEAVSIEQLEYEDLRGWRQLAAPPYEILPVTHARMINLAIEIYRRNPLAHSLINLTRDFVIGTGISLEAKDKKVQEVLDTHWYHPENNWDNVLNDRITSFFLTGELLLTAQATLSKDLLIGFIHPSKISELLQDPVNQESVKAIKIADRIPINGRETDTLSVVHFDRSKNRFDGDCFYFGINRPAPGLRGISDLFSLIDLMYAIEAFLLARARKASYLNAWCWDVTDKGLTEKQRKELETILRTQSNQPGGVLMHGEAAEINTLTPKLGGEDASADFLMIKNYMISARGFPPHWFAEVGGGRAIGAEAQEPSYRRLVARQEKIRQVLEAVLKYAVSLKLGANAGVNTSFKIRMPKIAIRDYQRLSGAFSKAAGAMITALDKGILGKDEARTFILTLAEEMGLGAELARELRKEV